MENLIRLFTAVGLFLLMVIWEYLQPKRLPPNRKQRWPINLGLALCNQLVLRFTVGNIAYLSAINAQQQTLGLFNNMPLPEWLVITLSLLSLDFAIYCQHILMHRRPWLWRLHQIHHSDMAFDASTAVRFHPLEISLSMAYKILWIYILGAHPLAVIAFEIVLNGSATFNHSNIALPHQIDNILRWLIITPDMHRIHHSIVPVEMDSNYGFSLSCWDRLCGTYTANSQQAQTTMPIGLPAYRDASQLGFLALLLMPFKPLPSTKNANE